MSVMVRRVSTAGLLALLGIFLPACGGGGVSGRTEGIGDEITAWDLFGDILLEQGLASDMVDSLDGLSGDTRPGGLDAYAEVEVSFLTDGPTDASSCLDRLDCAGSMGLAPPCHVWTCMDGTCVPEPLGDGTACDDGSACTVADHCEAGHCSGVAIACEDDHDPCTAETCDPASGCQYIPLTGHPCEDGSACTEGDQCVFGRCLGQQVLCDDGDPCTFDDCDDSSGCVHGPTPVRACDDGDACTRDDECHEGECRGVRLDCDDGNECTEDDCVSTLGCIHKPLNGKPCSDGSACTIEDHCEMGVCVGTPKNCNDGNPCTTEVCDPIQGCLYPPADGVGCNDGNPCTDQDRCAGGVCLGQATACDDDNVCTVDSCTDQSGCIHIQVPGLWCDDSNACTEGDYCSKGSCLPGSPVDCNDGNECTTDFCDPHAGCVNLPLSGTPCDDHDECTKDDRCVQGGCVGSPMVCDDANPCTGDSCDPETGCQYLPLATACDDGDPCTEGDYCEDGQCRPGRNPQCLAIKRVVLAGDSWSTGLIAPLRDALDARGYEEVAVSWELTAKPGSTVSGWLSDSNLMDALFVSLDAEPRAGILFFTLGGNDYLRACASGLGLMDTLGWFTTMTSIQWDLQAFVALAQSGRPHLKVVLIGYDYLNYLMIEALGFSFPGMNLVKFNLGMVDLAMRGRNVAQGTQNVVYAHNMGLIQHTFGDAMFGYGPGAAPKPGPAPTYDPFPVGWFAYPSPLAHIPDGIHPDYAGFRAIIENTLDQGPAAWIEGKPWP